MRQFFFGMILVLLAVQVSTAQMAVRAQLAPELTASASEPTPVTGCRYLRDEYETMAKYFQAHPEAFATRKTAGPAWNFEVGSQHSWWARNFTTSSYYQTASTCRAKGTTCYIFVEDSLWGVRVTQAQVDSIRVALDSRTPAFPTKGIYQVDVETFGDPPDVDNDPRIIVLILNILDGYAPGSPSFIAGYFDPRNQAVTTNSNQGEIYYLDANPANLASSAGLTSVIRTAAHEFQHMIHWKYDPSEWTFINEGLSEVAEVVIGYPIRSQSGYVNNTDVALMDWNSTTADYSRAARWMLYFWNQFPNDYLKKLVQTTSAGTVGIDAALAAYPSPRRFADIFIDWLIANYLNDASVDPKYGYTYSPLLKAVPARVHVDPNVPVTIEDIQSLGADYIRYVGGSNLNIMFTSASPDIRVKAIKLGSFSKQVADVPMNVPYQESQFGSQFQEIAFVVIKTGAGQPTQYTYTSSGTASVQTLELKYDDGQPEGFLPASPGDSILVWFDGVPGATLDSLRIAFRRAGSIQMGIWRFRGTFIPSPFGSPMVAPFQVVSTDSAASVPYPIPYNSWVKVDLRSHNLDASSNFAVSFLVGSDFRAPAVMVSSEPDDGNWHSFTYSQSSGNRWVVFSDQNNPSNTFRYLVRAYVRVGSLTGVEEVVELLPKSFALGQNYPNPFNPTTLIEYQLPSSEFVTLNVYDVLGRAVRALVNQPQHAGTYRVDWDGRDDGGRQVVSGVYYYQLRTPSFVKTNKMVLLK